VFGEFQWTLIGFVALVILAMLVYDRWKEGHAKARANHIFSHQKTAASADEDINGLGAGGVPDVDLGDDADRMPLWSEVETYPGHDSSEGANRGGVSPYDALGETAQLSPLNADIEFIIRFPFKITAARALAEMVDDMRMRLSSTVRIVGVREGIWQEIEHYSAKVYAQVEVGVLMANRAGPVRQETFEHLVRVAEQYAADHGGQIEHPDIALTTLTATELDTFCSEVDLFVECRVVVPEGLPFSAESLVRLVMERGLQYQDPGRFVMLSPSGELLFSVANKEPAPFTLEGKGVRTHGVTLSLEVPRCSAALEAFDLMIALAEHLADKLSGSLVDGQSRLLDSAHWSSNRAAIGDVCRRLSEHDMPSGGERAKRLFA